MKRGLSRKNLWEKTPWWLKATAGRGLSLVPPGWWFGARFRQNLRFVQESQWWSAERISRWQTEKMRDMLSLAYQRTRFYRNMLDRLGFRPEDFRSLEDFRRLPTIDKQTVIEQLSEMCICDVTQRNADFVSTGGTSGTPLHFYINAGRSSTEYAYLLASWERIDYRLGTPMAVLRGRVVRPDRRGLRHEYDPILRHHYYSSFHLSDENIARYLQHIATVGVCFLHAYPSSVAALARFCRCEERCPPSNIRGVIVESEIVYPEQKRVVEEVFGCRCFSSYGHSEKLVLAAECEQSADYHVWPTYGYFELLDEQGNPVTVPGQRGEIVGTGFINTVMPFVRYRTGDWATYVGNRCEACGREHTVIRDIRGHRIQEMLIAADGSEISWTSLNMHDDTFLHVRQFQFMQETPGRAVLRIVPAHGFAEGEKDRVQRNLGHKLNGRLIFTIELVDSIPLSGRGKAIYVDQRIPRECGTQRQSNPM